MAQDSEITTIGEKGQVVIPQKIRKDLKIKPKSKLLVSSKDGLIIMKVFELPDMEKDWEKMFRVMHAKNLKISEQEILDEIAAYRKEKRAKN